MLHPYEITESGYYWIVFHGSTKPEPAGFYGGVWFGMGSKAPMSIQKFLVIKECKFEHVNQL